MRIQHSHDHPADTGADQRLGARRRLPKVGARFQRDENGAAGRPVAGCVQSINFGVRIAGTLMPALADDIPVPDNHAAYHRVRPGRKFSPGGEFQRARHVRVIGRRETLHN